MKPESIDTFTIFLDRYIQAFLETDPSALRSMYCEGEMIYFDNHSDCDTFLLDDHISKVAEFLKSGNASQVFYKEPIVYADAHSACLITYFRYDGQDEYKIRTTFYLESPKPNEWKIRHVHCSELPSKRYEEEIRNKIVR